MSVKMIYHTPDYHKLVESIARVCYQSYGKVDENSHKLVRGIMNKGHLSVASSGNMVFEIRGEGINTNSGNHHEFILTLIELMEYKEINNFIRWTTPSNENSRQDVVTVSMNILTFLDIYNHIHEHGFDKLFKQIVEEVSKVPYLKWFFDSSVEVPPSESPYFASPSLGDPVVLTQDYTALKALGLTDYELDIHATVTVDYVTDRATGLQAWRHGDMTGGCELSQRYCDRSNAVVRELLHVGEYPDQLYSYAEMEEISIEEARLHFDAVVQSINNVYKSNVDFYADVNETLKVLGLSSNRAREVARTVLGNFMTTRIIQCRPLRQWKHFFTLRDTSHAQKEIREDARAMKKAFKQVGVSL